jgi:hypothetical protein
MSVTRRPLSSSSNMSLRSSSPGGMYVYPSARGLHSFPFQLNLSSSVHRITQLKS